MYVGRGLEYYIYTEQNRKRYTYILAQKYLLFHLFLNKMKSHMEIQFVWLSLVRNTCTSQMVTTPYLFYTQKKKLK